MRGFLSWCETEGFEMTTWLRDIRNQLEEINLCLWKFGRTVYSWGRPLNHFVETINALTSYRPELRRQVQAPWDIAFNWSRMEPNVHHIAAPFQIVMALPTVALMRGWVRIAGAIAMMWGSLLRRGELTSAIRQQLTLASDLERTITFGILSITEPKTRFTTARHQAARLDIPDLLQLAEMAFSSLSMSQRLWPFSGRTLRLRFKDLPRAVGLPTEKRNGLKPLDLGSLRAGGASWTLQMTESGELCRRRGRWVSQKVMDLYIQEASSLQYLNFVEPKVKKNVPTLAHAFPAVLEKAKGRAIFFWEFILFYWGILFVFFFLLFLFFGFYWLFGFCWLLASVGLWLLLAFGFCWLLASVGLGLLWAFGFCWLLASVGFWLLWAFWLLLVASIDSVGFVASIGFWLLLAFWLLLTVWLPLAFGFCGFSWHFGFF